MIRPRKLNGITIAVRDVQRSMAWYGEKFGFEKLFDDAPNSNGVTIGAGGVEICLQEVDSPKRARQADHAKDLCVRLVAFEVAEEDLRRVEAEFPEDKGIVVLDDHPQYRSRIVEDPDGHAIELYATK